MLISYFRRTNFFAFLKSFQEGFSLYRFKIALLVVLGFASGILEGVGINAAIPLFAFATKSGNLGTDRISKAIAEIFHTLHITFSLKYLLILISLLFFLKTLAVIVSQYTSIRITADFIERTRRDLWSEILKARWAYLLREKMGHLTTVIMTNVDYCELLLLNFCAMLVVIGSLVMYIAVAINISLPITALTVLMGFLFLFVFKPLVAKNRALAREAEQMNRTTAHHVNENLLGMKTVKAMAVGDAVVAEGHSYFAVLKKLKIKAAFSKLIPPSLMEPVGLVFVLSIFAFSYKQPNFNIAAMAAVVYLIQQIFLFVQKLQRHVQVINESYPYFKAILEYRTAAGREREEESRGGAFSFEKMLRFKEVGFQYDPSRPVLSGVSFGVTRGEMVGLIGSSGSGKTTIVDLLLRLFTPRHGAITLDEKDIGTIDLLEWRRHIGYVPQDMFLMNDTIAENIRFYDTTLTDGDIKNAARLAHIDDFISGLKDGYGTMVGERGIMLSAGQRQRIIIARVLARTPSILILDEATSALDNESEAQIQKVIEGLRGTLTVIVIAHRLSTVMNTDKVIALSDGKIIEEGSPAELLKNPESYFSTMHNAK